MKYAAKRRTVAAKKAAMDMRITMCTDEALEKITAWEMQNHGFYKKEAEERLRREREKRGLVDA